MANTRRRPNERNAAIAPYPCVAIIVLQPFFFCFYYLLLIRNITQLNNIYRLNSFECHKNIYSIITDTTCNVTVAPWSAGFVEKFFNFAQGFSALQPQRNGVFCSLHFTKHRYAPSEAYASQICFVERPTSS